MTYYRLPESPTLRLAGANLGDGYHSGRFTRTSSIFEHLQPEPLSIETGLRWQSFVSESHSELMKALDIEVSASAKYGAVGADAAAKFTDSLKIASTTIVVGVRVVSNDRAVRVPENSALASNAKALLDTDLAQFLNTYGDMYVREQWFGSELIIAGLLTAESEEKKREISAKLGVKYETPGLKAGVESEVRNTFETAASLASVQLQVYQSGASKFVLPTEAVKNPAVAVDKAAEWAAQDHGDSLQHVVCAPYSTLAVPTRQKKRLGEFDRLCRPFRANHDAIVTSLLEVEEARQHDPGVWEGAGRNEGLDAIQSKLDEALDANATDPDYKAPEEVMAVGELLAKDRRARRIIEDEPVGGPGGKIEYKWRDNRRPIRELMVWGDLRAEGRGPVVSRIECRLDGPKPSEAQFVGTGSDPARPSFGKGRWAGVKKRVPLSDDECVTAVEVRYDDRFVRQIVLTTSDGQQYAVPEKLPPELVTESKRYEGIVCGFSGHFGDLIDSLGVVHTAEAAFVTAP